MRNTVFPILVIGTFSFFTAQATTLQKDTHAVTEPSGTRYALEPGKTFDALKVGSGSLLFGQSVVYRVAVDGFVVCELKGYECARVGTLTEAQALIDAHAASKTEGDGGTIAQILSKVAEDGAADYAFPPE